MCTLSVISLNSRILLPPPRQHPSTHCVTIRNGHSSRWHVRMCDDGRNCARESNGLPSALRTVSSHQMQCERRALTFTIPFTCVRACVHECAYVRGTLPNAELYRTHWHASAHAGFPQNVQKLNILRRTRCVRPKVRSAAAAVTVAFAAAAHAAALMQQTQRVRHHFWRCVPLTHTIHMHTHADASARIFPWRRRRLGKLSGAHALSHIMRVVHAHALAVQNVTFVSCSIEIYLHSVSWKHKQQIFCSTTSVTYGVSTCTGFYNAILENGLSNELLNRLEYGLAETDAELCQLHVNICTRIQ